MTTVYGIKNCDTMKKTFKWLDAHGIDYVFYDYRKNGLDRAMMIEIESALGWEQLVNKRGTTYRQLPDDVKTKLDHESALIQMLELPAMIKRPVIQHNGKWLVGFKESALQEVFNV